MEAEGTERSNTDVSINVCAMPHVYTPPAAALPSELWPRPYTSKAQAHAGRVHAASRRTALRASTCTRPSLQRPGPCRTCTRRQPPHCPRSFGVYTSKTQAHTRRVHAASRRTGLGASTCTRPRPSPTPDVYTWACTRVHALSSNVIILEFIRAK